MGGIKNTKYLHFEKNKMFLTDLKIGIKGYYIRNQKFQPFSDQNSLQFLPNTELLN